MEKVRYGQANPMSKKGKKKQVKGELDRMKQAEKKRKRLEKALAASAAIRSELEKKKQKKLEEQQRLDEEGASIAEAVALHVLGEDTDEPCHFAMNHSAWNNCWNYSGNIDLFMGYESSGKHCLDLNQASSAYEPVWKCNRLQNQSVCPPQTYTKGRQLSPQEGTSQVTDFSVGLLAAQAVSSLQIAEDPNCAQFSGQGATTVLINKMLGGRRLQQW
ncbi:uncharacterized protein LOC122053411 [Zingiber officinale]|uniref:uncharacterized protein LOC122053411 n=1 Tax=Zingiber officinale TaxID=94328 RepID=UPI001C4C70C4|nr:uncharacterized protein LOC122053411 [Zingiber officinale]